MEKLKEAQEEAAKKKQFLDAKRAELKVVQDKLAALTASFKKTQQELADLRDKKEMCETHLDRAGKLLAGLRSQSTTWNENLDVLGVDKKNLTGNMILCGGMIAYLGPFTKE